MEEDGKTMLINEKKQALRDLILAILTRTGEVPKVKLAKLILFAEIEHYKKTGKSITGLYFVRLVKGPVIAFYDEVLDQGEGTDWKKRTELVEILEEGRKKTTFLYEAQSKSTLPKVSEEIIKGVVDKYGNETGTRLSFLSHDLAAWRNAEPNEPIYIAELAVKDEEEYFALIDLVEELEESDDILAEQVSSALQQAEK